MLKLENLVEMIKEELSNQLNESKVGDFYINIGEAIDNIDSESKKLGKLLKKLPKSKKGPMPILLNLEKIESAIYDLKKIFSESYDFGRDRSGIKLKAKNFAIEDVVDRLDDIATFKRYKNFGAEYDDPIYIDVPYELMDKYGFNKRLLQKIEDNTYEYGHHISFDDNKKILTIHGPKDWGDNTWIN